MSAFQSGLVRVGVDRAKFEDVVRAATRGASMSYPGGLVGRAAVDKFKLSRDA